MRARSKSGGSAGFTRNELIVLIGVISLAAAVAGSFFIASKREARAKQCESNLKEITLGLHLWMADTESSFLPWDAFYPIGNRDLTNAPRQNLWFQFGSLSNQLKSPRVLADPADRRRDLRPASNWSSSPAGGFFHANYQNDACSYALCLDMNAFTNPDGYPNAMSPPWIFDRHFTDSGKRGDCVYDFRHIPSYPLCDIGYYNSPFLLVLAWCRSQEED